MPHAMILGPTECGKTRLAKHIAKQVRARGLGVLVLDPLSAKWPDADFVTDDVEVFMRIAFQNQRCLLIVDEAGEAIGRAQSDATRHRVALATRSRHQGHSAIFISQRANLIPPAIRTQCTKAWIFRQHFEDLKTLSREFCNEGVMSAANLTQGRCILCDTFGNTQEIDVFAIDKLHG